MVTLTNAVYGINNSVAGAYTAPVSIVPAEFTGASLGLGALGPVKLNGSFSNPGDSITAFFGTSTTAYTVVYEGYYLVGGEPVYVLKPTDTALGLSAFAVHAEPITVNITVVQPLLASTAPTDPSTPCFLRGTMIATPAGETAVECLRVGDLVNTIETGGIVAKPVTWIGSRSIRSMATQRDDAFPIRIRQHAFAADIPHRDLLVTPEHCILTEAGLVPARMLVNGASILIDREIDEYEFFHIELDRHGILLSEGLTTESYLDTGNHGRFGHGQTDVVRSGVPSMAAPLAVGRGQVEPVWNRLANRASELGLPGRTGIRVLTDQPNLRLLLDDGRELLTCWRDEMRHLFRIPRGTTPVRLLSRSAVPAGVIGPFVDDRRMLGVSVDRLVLWHGLDGQVMPLADIDLAGWHQNEGGRRWTDGNASLDLPHADNETFLDVHLAATLLYPDEVLVSA